MLNSPLLREASIAEEVAERGYAITPDYLTAHEIDVLVHDLRRLQQSGQMKEAGIGQNAEVTNTVRGDSIYWLEETHASPAQGLYLRRLEQLRLAFNQSMFLGLFDYEGHFARYPAGAFYRKHLDQFQHNNQRTLTTILYLNHEWNDEDGGQLRIYLNGEENESQSIDILPRAGTLVTFLASRFWHEVLPARRERLSITGWFRTRPQTPAV